MRLLRNSTVAIAYLPILWVFTGPYTLAQGPGAVAKPGRVETVELLDGSKFAGKLISTASGSPAVLRQGDTVPIPWERVRKIQVEGGEPNPATGSPPFQIHLGAGHRISGRLLGVQGDRVRLDAGNGRPPWSFDRPGVTAILQRPGEVQVFKDGFEAIDQIRWSRTGLPEARADRHLVGEMALTLPAGGSSLTTRIPKPFGSGRVDLAYWDTGAKVPGQRWFLDLTFRKGVSELFTMRVVPAWAEETLAVETPGGPTMPIQPLARKEGWHRLAVQFDDERSAITLDGDDLAHGRGFGGPLIEIRLATETLGAAQPPADLAAIIDDLRVTRLVEPTGRFEVDPSQDEIRLVSGDQVFGKLAGCDSDFVRFTLEGREVKLSWAEVAGIFPSRSAKASQPLGGVWAEVQWRTAAGTDARDLDQAEGVISGVDEANLTLQVPYLGVLAIPRDAIRRISFEGRSNRVVVDVHSHHLGNRVSPDLDPPQAEASPVEIPFSLGAIPAGNASVLVDVVQLIGEEGTQEYSPLVKKGELLTGLTLNGRKLDNLNRHVKTQNETPLRIRIAIPSGVLKVGENRLKFDQIGTLADPQMRDNFGIQRLAIDFTTEGPARP